MLLNPCYAHHWEGGDTQTHWVRKGLYWWIACGRSVCQENTARRARLAANAHMRTSIWRHCCCCGVMNESRTGHPLIAWIFMAKD